MIFVCLIITRPKLDEKMDKIQIFGEHYDIITKHVTKQCMCLVNIQQEKFEDTKGIIRSCKSKNRQYNGQTETGQTVIYKTLYIATFYQKMRRCLNIIQAS